MPDPDSRPAVASPTDPPADSTPSRQTPELLAPAGDWTCVTAAIENGADAVYFGLETGFNARARAKNFSLDDVEQLMATLHRRGVRGYVTLNTLVFAGELKRISDAVIRIAEAGVDAVLVQDLGIASLVRRICPDLQVHASTQMTMTSVETIAAASELGLSRVVLARELSIAEIKKIASSSNMPLEAFVHGALCVAYSGQCLTSESLGGRSANRGQCAQACRLPYELIVDGRDRPLGDVRYLLSPQDLAGYHLIPQLIDAGVCSLKIEGRLKTPEYVANITGHYRRAIDDAVAGRPSSIQADDVREMEMSFSRGFSPGWLLGNDHKRLVPGTESAKRGVPIGEVVAVGWGRVTVNLAGRIARGDGVAFDGDRVGGDQQGGRVFNIRVEGRPVEASVAQGRVELEFGRGAIDTQKIQVGARMWKNDDPALNRRLRRTFTSTDPIRRQPVDFDVTAATGRALEIRAICGDAFADYRSEEPLAAAQNRPATQEAVVQQLGRLGGTPFRIGNCRCRFTGSPMIPASVLNAARRQLTEELSVKLSRPPRRIVNRGALESALAETRSAAESDRADSAAGTELRVLCRTLDQVKQAAESGIRFLYVDFHDIREYREAVRIAHAGDCEIYIASVRVHKPGESGLLKVLTRHGADGFLVRNLASLDYFHRAGYPVVGDFSLNVVNPLTADWLLGRGCRRVTASYDLNRDQLLELAGSMPASRLEVVLHQHMPMFHMEHCVFCSVLSSGTDKTNCGRPCDRHRVELRDRVGMEHPLQADIACRNTLYNAVPQSGAEAFDELSRLGVESFRIELLGESGHELDKVLSAYRGLIDGTLSGAEVWRQLKATNRVGVTRGTLEPARNPLAII